MRTISGLRRAAPEEPIGLRAAALGSSLTVRPIQESQQIQDVEYIQKIPGYWEIPDGRKIQEIQVIQQVRELQEALGDQEV
ncbi:hypothetical protein HPB52_012142 [Rhipicephalus sanguineus]|uniref:Uncharacterized protein n=1 Tax=Rhipicephalus sanguineus TaxID=34632 RepID=A0A9D4PIM7_RHISA|nr:hypothetical protein HPB52_012142 [Rhipicephalus sanguineus]